MSDEEDLESSVAFSESDGGEHSDDSEDAHGGLLFVAVGRIADNTLLATCRAEGQASVWNMEDISRKLLAAAQAKMKPGCRSRFKWNSGSVCCLVSQQGDLFANVITLTLDYPERFAYRLLTEVVCLVKGLKENEWKTARDMALTQKLQSGLHSRLVKYSELSKSNEKTKVLEDIGKVKRQMHGNVQQVRENTKNLRLLHGKTGNMAKTADRLHQCAVEINARYDRARLRQWALYSVGVVIVLLLLYFFVL